MRHSWEFDLSEEIDAVDSLSMADLVTSVFQRKKVELGIFLSYYYKGNGGIVEEVELSDVVDQSSPTAGKLKLSFKVVYFNACWNIHGDDTDHMDVNFEWDPEGKILKLIGPFWPEREPDEI